MAARQQPPGSGCVCATLRKATRSVSQIFDESLRPSGLRSTQFNILAEIHGRGSTTMTALAKILVLDQTTLTRNLAVLQRDGLLKFGSSQDARVKSVELTKKGANALQKALPLWSAAQKKMLITIGSDVWESLSRELNRLAHVP